MGPDNTLSRTQTVAIYLGVPLSFAATAWLTPEAWGPWRIVLGLAVMGAALALAIVTVSRSLRARSRSLENAPPPAEAEGEAGRSHRPPDA